MATKRLQGKREEALALLRSAPNMTFEQFSARFTDINHHTRRSWFAIGKESASAARAVQTYGGSAQTTESQTHVSPLTLPNGEARIIAEIQRAEHALNEMRAAGSWSAYVAQSSLCSRLYRQLADMQGSNSDSDSVPRTKEDYAERIHQYCQAIPGLRALVLDLLHSE